MWRLSDGRVEQTFETQGSTSALAISRDGDRIVHGSRIIDARSGRPEHRIRTSAFGRHALTSASFSPDGRFVVTTGTDQEARLFDVATGGQVWVLSHASTISDAAFSADGRWVVIAGPGYAGVVDARSGERILLLKRYDTLLTAAAFSPTGWRIATGSDSGAIRTYDCRLCGEIDELVKLGEERLAQIRRAP